MHPSITAVLDFFPFDHLPEPLRGVSQRFHDLAHQTAELAPNDPETTVALRKLLEAKDCAVRAFLRASKKGS